MSYEEQQARRSRVVVETPVARREVTQTESVRSPEGGMSGAAIGAIVVLAVALVTLLVLFLMSGQQTDENLATETQQPTTVVQQPATQQPPVIIQQAPPAPQQAPIIVTPPAPSGGAASSAPASSGSADLAIQAEIDKRIVDSPTFSTLGVTVSVINGKATIIGTVQNNELKMQLERLVRDVRGVKEIDNQIIVSG
jgi:hypothetical protein